MYNKWNRIILSVSTLFVGTGLATSAVAADQMMLRDHGEAVAMSNDSEIPTHISNEPQEDEPDGTCATCSVDDVTYNDIDPSNTSATLKLYFEDNGEDEVADIELRVLLENGDYEYLTVPSVQLYDGSLHIIDLPEGFNWSWAEARYIWVEVK